MLSRK